MTLLLLIMGLWQTPPLTQDLPRVGDTVWVERSVRVPARAGLRFPVPTSSELYSFLGPPRIEFGGSGQDRVLRYAVVVWRAGQNQIEIPGPVVVGATGEADTLPAVTVTVRVAAVLPTDDTDSIPPQPAASILAQTETVLWPAVFLPAVGFGLLLPVLLWWRRRPPRSTSPATQTIPRRSVDTDRLQRWVDSGEVSMAARHWEAILADVSVPGTDPECDQILQILAQSRFRVPGDTRVAHACQKAAARWEQHEQAAQ